MSQPQELMSQPEGLKKKPHGLMTHNHMRLISYESDSMAYKTALNKNEAVTTFYCAASEGNEASLI